MVKSPPANAGDTVQSLVWENPTGRGATKPVTTVTEAHAQQRPSAAKIINK